MFSLYSSVPLREKAPRWLSLAKGYTNLFGHSPFADLFLHDAKLNQIALLSTEYPELIELDFSTPEEFSSGFLADPRAVSAFFKKTDFELLKNKLGELGPEDCFFAVPYRAVGGTGNIETYQKGNLLVHLDLYGQTVL